MLAINLGIDPFWFSSATFTMAGSTTLYVADIHVAREDVSDYYAVNPIVIQSFKS